MAEFLKTNLNSIINRTPITARKIASNSAVMTPKFKNSNLDTLLSRTPITPKHKPIFDEEPLEDSDKKVSDEQHSLPTKKRLGNDLNWKQ